MDPKLYTKGRNKLVKLSVSSLFYQYRIKMLHVIFIDFLTAVGFFMVVIFIASYFWKYTNIGGAAQYINTFNMILFAIFTLVGAFYLIGLI